jgi:hypothetical protein
VYPGEIIEGRKEPFEGKPFDIDAAIRIGSEMIIFECKSKERPLDFEIGNPETLEVRREKFQEALDQVYGVESKIRAQPAGRNYEFSYAKKFTRIVVSPFVEWIWDRSEELWLPDGSPRIMSVHEATKYVEGRLSA